MRPDISALEAGRQLDDFDLLVLLGEGAFARVFLARQRSLQRLVALKVSDNRGSEPQTLAQLDHPHIVRVYDQRILAAADLRLLYMKYVPGGTLRDVVLAARDVPVDERSGRTVLESVDAALDERGEIGPAESPARKRMEQADWTDAVCQLGVQLAEALDYAHGKGVLHRDLKPANILMTAEGTPQIADFNVAFAERLSDETAQTSFGGTLPYMSPEQLEACRGRRAADSLDGRSDLFSLGVVLWELLAGEPPFPPPQAGATWTVKVDQLAWQRQEGVAPERLAEFPAEVPERVRESVLLCLAPAPEQRYRSAAELAGTLRLCMEPRAYRMVHPPLGSWELMAGRLRLVLIGLIALVPNVLAAVFNYYYNHETIIVRLQDSEVVFGWVQLIINGLAFPMGLLAMFFVVWPTLRSADDLMSDEQRAALRARCLRSGHLVALICIVEWTFAGVVYPIALQAGGVTLSTSDAFHFVVSLALCGLIAASYPFFGITAFCLRTVYPPLLPASVQLEPDRPVWDWLNKTSWVYLALGFLVPMLGTTLLAGQNSSASQMALFLLSGGSLIGCFFIFWLARGIHADLEALGRV